MKHYKLPWIFLLLFFASCGGHKNGHIQGPVIPVKPIKDPQVADAYTEEEKTLGEKVLGCFETFHDVFRGPDLEFVALGFTGNKCLQMKSFEKLSLVRSAYWKHIYHNEVNWSLVGRNILKLDKK